MKVSARLGGRTSVLPLFLCLNQKTINYGEVYRFWQLIIYLIPIDICCFIYLKNLYKYVEEREYFPVSISRFYKDNIMLNEIKTKIVLAVQRQRMYDPVLKDTVDKVLVTFNDGKVNGYLADEWDNMMTQVDSMLEKAFIVEPKASRPQLD